MNYTGPRVDFDETEGFFRKKCQRFTGMFGN